MIVISKDIVKVIRNDPNTKKRIKLKMGTIVVIIKIKTTNIKTRKIKRVIIIVEEIIMTHQGRHQRLVSPIQKLLLVNLVNGVKNANTGPEGEVNTQQMNIKLRKN
jgi:hypothetical protein